MLNVRGRDTVEGGTCGGVEKALERGGTSDHLLTLQSSASYEHSSAVYPAEEDRF